MPFYTVWRLGVLERIAALLITAALCPLPSGLLPLLPLLLPPPIANIPGIRTHALR
jgi:hypothetical protein